MAELAPLALEPKQNVFSTTAVVENAKGADVSLFFFVSGLTTCRCHRLNKDCQLSTAIRRRQNNKRKPITKVDRLEEKLDGLVTLIQSNTQPLAARNSDISPPPSHNHLTPDSMQSLTTSYDQSREDQNAEMVRLLSFCCHHNLMSLHI